MWKQKIGICLEGKPSVPVGEHLAMLKRIGFDAVSPVWSGEEELKETFNAAREQGLEIHSLHAPFTKAADLWSPEDKRAELALQTLLTNVDACQANGIGILVVHTWIGFSYTFKAEDLRFDCFDLLVSHAKERKVSLAFENTEGEEYLFALMDRYKNEDSVGFCWDSGHELCYNRSQDLLEKLGDRLLVTHLNDNLGISRYDGEIFWTDDLHLLPYDGIIDWDDVARRLKKARRLSILNFELNTHSKPDRHENDLYTKMSPELFYTEAYKRACKIAYRYSK